MIDSDKISAAVFSTGRKNSVKDFTIKNVGMLNPWIPAEGSASVAVTPTSSIIIVGKTNATEVKAIVSRCEYFPKPENFVGTPVALTKVTKNNISSPQDGFVVLGYVDSKGELFGWVPDKQMQCFTFFED